MGIVLMGVQKKWSQVKTGRGTAAYVGALEEPVREALVATKGVCWLEVDDFLEGPEWHAVIRQRGLSGKEARHDAGKICSRKGNKNGSISWKVGSVFW